MDSSVVPYKETRQIRKTIKERIHYLDRNTTEKGKPSSFNETQFDHSTGTNAHENLSTNKQKAATVAFYKPILSMRSQAAHTARAAYAFKILTSHWLSLLCLLKF